MIRNIINNKVSEISKTIDEWLMTNGFTEENIEESNKQGYKLNYQERYEKNSIVHCYAIWKDNEIIDTLEIKINYFIGGEENDY